MAHPHTPSSPAPRPDDPLDLETSVAGEEDPGASIDLANVPAAAPGTGQPACPRCGGSGRVGALACPECQGTGKVDAGAGGA